MLALMVGLYFITIVVVGIIVFDTERRLMTKLDKLVSEMKVNPSPTPDPGYSEVRFLIDRVIEASNATDQRLEELLESFSAHKKFNDMRFGRVGMDISNLLKVTNTKPAAYKEHLANSPSTPVEKKEKPESQLAYLHKLHYRGPDQEAQDSVVAIGRSAGTVRHRLVVLCATYNFGQNIKYTADVDQVTCKSCLSRLAQIAQKETNGSTNG